MSLDLSVTVWTIVTFVALMLLLDRFLFRPLNAFMRDRQARIDAGIEQARLAEEKEAAVREKLDKSVENARRTGLQAAEDDVFQYQKSVRGRLDTAREAADRQREQTREELEEEHKRIEAAVCAKMPDLTEILANRLLKKSLPPQ